MRDTKSGRIVNNASARVKLYDPVSGAATTHTVYRLTLEAFFPSATYFERPADDDTVLTVDHIDEKHINPHVTNLQYMTSRQNSLKSNTKQPRPKRCVWRKNTRGERVKRYESVAAAAHDLGIDSLELWRNVRNNDAEFEYEDFGSDTESDEEWITNPRIAVETGLLDVFVSNKGRVRVGEFGKRTRGSTDRYSQCPKRRRFTVEGKSYTLSQLKRWRDEEWK